MTCIQYDSSVSGCCSPGHSQSAKDKESWRGKIQQILDPTQQHAGHVELTERVFDLLHSSTCSRAHLERSSPMAHIVSLLEKGQRCGVILLHPIPACNDTSPCL